MNTLFYITNLIILATFTNCAPENTRDISSPALIEKQSENAYSSNEVPEDSHFLLRIKGGKIESVTRAKGDANNSTDGGQKISLRDAAGELITSLEFGIPSSASCNLPDPDKKIESKDMQYYVEIPYFADGYHLSLEDVNGEAISNYQVKNKDRILINGRHHDYETFSVTSGKDSLELASETNLIHVLVFNAGYGDKFLPLAKSQINQITNLSPIKEKFAPNFKWHFIKKDLGNICNQEFINNIVQCDYDKITKESEKTGIEYDYTVIFTPSTRTSVAWNKKLAVITAGNLAQGAIKHEMGHLFGLNDEYFSAGYTGADNFMNTLDVNCLMGQPPFIGWPKNTKYYQGCGKRHLYYRTVENGIMKHGAAAANASYGKNNESLIEKTLHMRFFAPKEKPSRVSVQKSTFKGFKVFWPPVEGATHYRVIRYQLPKFSGKASDAKKHIRSRERHTLATIDLYPNKFSEHTAIVTNKTEYEDKFNADYKKGYYYAVQAGNGTHFGFGTSKGHPIGEEKPLKDKPTRLNVSRINHSAVAYLTWNTLPGALTYNLYRKVEGEVFFRKIGETGVTHFKDKGLLPSTNVSYYVTGQSGKYQSPASDTVSYTTSAAEIDAPIYFRILKSAKSYLQLAWKPNTKKASEVYIYIGQYRIKGETDWTTSFRSRESGARVSGLEPKTKYEFRVRSATWLCLSGKTDDCQLRSNYTDTLEGETL